MKYSIYTNKKVNLSYIRNEVESMFPDFHYVDYLKGSINYLFVYGGDGTFIKVLKENCNKNIKCILISKGLNGFLSSLKKLDNSIFLETNYDSFNYLKINNYICINETFIDFQKITNIDTFINNEFVKKIMCSKVFFVNNIGTTGIARTYRYPLILSSNPQYIMDFLEEPLYHYYKSLNQPFILSKKNFVSLKFNYNLYFYLKIDNKNIKEKNNKIDVFMLKSKMKILNFQNKALLFEKINQLF